MACKKMDDCVKEYLIFRGLHAAAKAIENELKFDKDRAYSVDKIIDQIHGYISSYDAVGLTEYWSMLEQYIFVHVDQSQMPAVNRLRTSVQRVCLVTAIQAGRGDRVTEFFDKLMPHVHSQPDWKDWLVLRHSKNPEENTTFALYFSRQWQDTLFLSLHNFISIILSTMPKPALMSCEEDQRLMTRLEEENSWLRKKIEELRHQTHAEVALEVDKGFESSDLALPCGIDNHSVPACVEVVDGFYLLTQDNNVVIERQPPAKRTDQIRLFIRNIGMPSQASVGRKVAAPSSQPTANAVSVASTAMAGSSGSLTSSLSSVNSPVHKQQSVVDSGAVASNTVVPTSVNPKQMVSQKSAADIPVQQAVGDGVFECSSSNSQDFLLLSQDEYAEHSTSIVQCRCNQSGQSVASLDADGVLKIWTPQPSPVTVATTMSKSTLTSLEWVNKNDRLLLLGTKVGSVRLFDMKEKKILKEVSTDATCPRVVALASNPIGSQFTCSSVGRLRSSSPAAELSTLRVGKLSIWDLRTMKVEHNLSLSPGPIAVNSLAYNHNGQLLLTGAADGLLRLYDMNSRDCIAQWGGETAAEIHTVSFSADETSCYSLSSDGKLSQWSINKTGRKISEHLLHNGASGPFVHVGSDGQRQSFTPRGRLFALDANGQHMLTCAPQGGIVYQLESVSGLAGQSALTPVLSLRGHQSPVVTVDWSSSVHYCLTAALDGRICVATLLSQQ